MKHQLIKTLLLDHETMQNPNVKVEMICVQSDERFKSTDLGQKRKLLHITIVDLNDNLVYVSEDSKYVIIYREALDFIVVKSIFQLLNLFYLKNYFLQG